MNIRLQSAILTLSPRAQKSIVLILVLLCFAAAGALIQQNYQSSRTRCLTNQRRLAMALLMYSQDYNGYLPPSERQNPDGNWQSWFDLACPEQDEKENEQCPANRANAATEYLHGFAFPCSYALNGRFYGQFSEGPFPLENLEIPAQTALLVESGPVRKNGPFEGPSENRSACRYSDTASQGRLYPSPHRNKMNIVAADGHAKTVKVEHYQPAGHNPLYGRIGDGIYNWNGGYPNGKTDGPAVE